MSQRYQKTDLPWKEYGNDGKSGGGKAPDQYPDRDDCRSALVGIQHPREYLQQNLRVQRAQSQQGASSSKGASSSGASSSKGK